MFGYIDFAKGFGLRGVNVTDLGQLPAPFDAFVVQDRAEVWNVRVSDKVIAPQTRHGTPVTARGEQEPGDTRRGYAGFRCGSAADLAAQSVLLLIGRAMLGAGQVAVVEARHKAL